MTVVVVMPERVAYPGIDISMWMPLSLNYDTVWTRINHYLHLVARLKPDVHVKGADYANKPIPERAIVEAYGGRVELIPLVPGRSTTSTLERLNGKSSA